MLAAHVVLHADRRLSASQRSTDEKFHACEVVSVRGSGATAEYYIHFIDFDRRLDRWVPASWVRAPTKASDDGGAGGDKDGDGVGSDRKRSADGCQRVTRRGKRRRMASLGGAAVSESHDPELAKLEREHAKMTRVKNVDSIYMGGYDMKAWYYSPYPSESTGQRRLFICEYCLKYMRKCSSLQKHSQKCRLRHPPGDEIYRDGNLSVFEVDGSRSRVYCQCLCLLSKLFLDHKTLYYGVESFLFYVLCESDASGFHPVGYFSKEKKSINNNNVACILTFPPFQRKGYGRFLIALSYELSRVDRCIGSPEKPLSDLGNRSYRSYWTRVLLGALAEQRRPRSVKELSEETYIEEKDIVNTLKSLNMISYFKGMAVISTTPKTIEMYQRVLNARPDRVPLDADKLQYQPLAGRT